MNPELDRLRQELLMAQPPSAPRLDPQMLQGYLKTSGFANALSQGLGGPKIDNQLGDVLQAIGISRDQLLDDWKNQITLKKNQISSEIDFEELAMKQAESNLRKTLLGEQTGTEKAQRSIAESKQRVSEATEKPDIEYATSKAGQQRYQELREGLGLEKDIETFGSDINKSRQDAKLAQLKAELAGATFESDIAGSKADSQKKKLDLREALIKTDLISQLVDSGNPEAIRIANGLILGVDSDELNPINLVMKTDPFLTTAKNTPGWFDEPGNSERFFDRAMVLSNPELTNDIRVVVVSPLMDIKDKLLGDKEYSNLKSGEPRDLTKPDLTPKGQEIFEEQVIEYLSQPEIYNFVKLPSNQKAFHKVLKDIEMEFTNVKVYRGERISETVDGQEIKFPIIQPTATRKDIPNFLWGRIRKRYAEKIGAVR